MLYHPSDSNSLHLENVIYNEEKTYNSMTIMSAKQKNKPAVKNTTLI